MGLGQGTQKKTRVRQTWIDCHIDIKRTANDPVFRPSNCNRKVGTASLKRHPIATWFNVISS